MYDVSQFASYIWNEIIYLIYILVHKYILSICFVLVWTTLLSSDDGSNNI